MNTQPTSDTPETDAAEYTGKFSGFVNVTFARSLETRLKAALAEVELKTRLLSERNVNCSAQGEVIVELKTKLTTLQQENVALREIVNLASKYQEQQHAYDWAKLSGALAHYHSTIKGMN